MAIFDTLLGGPGNHASRPADGAYVDALYVCTEHGKVYQWDGSAWGDYFAFDTPASASAVVDAGGFYASGDVEGALQELGDHDHDADYEPAGTTAAHEADTTAVHGIADTSALETTTGAQSKADAAEAAAAAALATHEGNASAHHAPGGGGGGGGGFLAALSYDGSDSAAAGSTISDVDATNLAITFTAPPSGKVIVALEGGYFISNSGNGYLWGLREGTTTLAEDFVEERSATELHQYRGRVSFLITGLTPGSSHTYKWAHRRSYGSGNCIVKGASSYSRVMTVADAEGGGGGGEHLLTVTPVSGTTYTVLAADEYVDCTNAGAVTVTLPQDSEQAVPVGRTVPIRSSGAGGLTVAAGTGATVTGAGSIAQHETLTAFKAAANTWHVTGATS